MALDFSSQLRVHSVKLPIELACSLKSHIASVKEKKEQMLEIRLYRWLVFSPEPLEPADPLEWDRTREKLRSYLYKAKGLFPITSFNYKEQGPNPYFSRTGNKNAP